MNILRQARPVLDKPLLVPAGRECEARNLVTLMVEHSAEKRPTIQQSLNHPFFWSHSNQLRFLERVKDFLDTRGSSKVAAEAARALDMKGAAILGRNWGSSGRVHPELVAHAAAHGGSRCITVCDLVRLVRNTTQHYRSMSAAVKTQHGDTPNQFWLSIKTAFPEFFMHVYDRIMPLVRQRQVVLEGLDMSLVDS